MSTGVSGCLICLFFLQPLSFLLSSRRKTFSVYLRLFLAHASFSSLIIYIFTFSVPLFNSHLSNILRSTLVYMRPISCTRLSNF